MYTNTAMDIIKRTVINYIFSKYLIAAKNNINDKIPAAYKTMVSIMVNLIGY